MSSPKEEATKIVNALYEELGCRDENWLQGRFVPGQEAVEWMEEHGYPSVNQVEWPGFYLKHLVQHVATTKYPERFEELNVGRQYLVKGNYLWDTRFFTEGNNPYIILNDINVLDDRLEEYGGFGLLLAESITEYDDDFSFHKWRLEQKGGPSEYELKRREEGVPARRLKAAFMVIDIFAFYFTKEQFEQGLEEGWITDDQFQSNWRNQDDTPRNPKYLLYLNGVPPECRLLVRNYNSDPKEFEDIYGAPALGRF
ncbi:MAG: hypothetical protein GF308_11595 [Candidatus Heimdallarchaeota archaeon]|nr:hypothetical protein [Candidatus Heimdallarchaeota archaeon]